MLRASERVPRRQQPAPLEAAVPCRADWRVARLFSRRLALEGAWRCWRARASKQGRRLLHQTFGPTPVLPSVAATSENDGDILSDLRDDLHQTAPALSPAPVTVHSSGGLSWTPPSSNASPSGRPRSSGGGCGSSGWPSSRPPPALATPSSVSVAGARQAAGVLALSRALRSRAAWSQASSLAALSSLPWPPGAGSSGSWLRCTLGRSRVAA